MADLAQWAKSAKMRYEQYQSDRGEASKGARTQRATFSTMPGAGRELASIAKMVPPL